MVKRYLVIMYYVDILKLLQNIQTILVWLKIRQIGPKNKLKINCIAVYSNLLKTLMTVILFVATLCVVFLNKIMR